MLPPENEFRILGPLEVSVGDRPVRLGGQRQRALLAILLLNPGEVVSSERLAEGIWGESAPASARHLVQVYVSQLRGALDGAAAIVTREPGYLVDIEPSRIDAGRFERLVEAARDADAQAPATRSVPWTGRSRCGAGRRSPTRAWRAAPRSTWRAWTRCA